MYTHRRNCVKESINHENDGFPSPGISIYRSKLSHFLYLHKQHLLGSSLVAHFVWINSTKSVIHDARNAQVPAPFLEMNVIKGSTYI